MPEESPYAPAVKRPEDFEGFWRNAMSELAGLSGCAGD